jgi:hypothetical protein
MQYEYFTIGQIVKCAGVFYVVKKIKKVYNELSSYEEISYCLSSIKRPQHEAWVSFLKIEAATKLDLLLYG